MKPSWAMQVVMVRKRDTSRLYAMKILSKSYLVEREEIEHIKSERAILAQNSNCPFLVGLKVLACLIRIHQNMD